MQIGTRAVTYNGDNMPDSIVYTKGGTDTIIDFAYDASGKRAKKSVGGASDTYYVNELFQIKDTGGARENTSYIFAGNLRVAMLKDGTPYYFHKDHLGSSSVLSDDTGEPVETTAYLPYGHERSHAGADISDYRFTDQELDRGTGLYNYDARLYDPVTGRFIMGDTEIPDLFNPQSLNRYAYCLNNPLKYVDPDGHFAVVTILIMAKLGALSFSYFGFQTASAGINLMEWNSKIGQTNLVPDTIKNSYTFGNKLWSYALETNRAPLSMAISSIPYVGTGINIFGSLTGIDLFSFSNRRRWPF